MTRGIDLRDFQIELRHPESGRTIKSEGGLVGLMERRGRWHDAEIAEYYAARGKLADLDCKLGLLAGPPRCTLRARDVWSW
jgi:hypothetical protein